MRNSVCVFLLHICLLHSCGTRKVAELLFEFNTTNPSTYRLSAPQLKQPLNRGSAQLQDIKYVYEDADDVINIIEPPQRFQLLKQPLSQTENPQKLRIICVKAMNQLPKPKPMAMKGATTGIFSASKFKMKVKKIPESAVKQLQTVKQQLGDIKVNQPVTLLQTNAHNGKPVFSNEASSDLMPQEAQREVLAVMSPPLPLPREILASVRKTERLLQQQPQHNKHLHRVTQRQKQLTTHTVVIGQAFERKKFYRANDHKIMDEKLRQTRVRREVHQISDHEESLAGARRTDKVPSALDVLKSAKLDIEKGTKLLLHLDELLKNANLYLSDKGEVVDVREQENNSNKNHTESITYSLSEPNDMGLRKLKKSSNATNSLERRRLSNQNQSENKKRRIFTDVNANKPISLTNQASRDGVNKTNYNQYIAGSLLYDDVMSNIKNMQQTKNLQLLEDHQNRKFNEKKVPVDLNRSLPLLPIDNNKPVEAKQLQEYIYELSLSKSLQNQDTGVSSTPTLQSKEFSNISDSNNWYLITSEGSIYGARLGSKPKSTTSFFRRFPDIPVKRHAILNNQTLLSVHARLA